MIMPSSEKRVWLTLFMPSVFLLLWIWIEVSEYIHREEFQTDVINFVDKGERFTRDDGDNLTRRVEALEDGRSD